MRLVLVLRKYLNTAKSRQKLQIKFP